MVSEARDRDRSTSDAPPRANAMDSVAGMMDGMSVASPNTGSVVSRSRAGTDATQASRSGSSAAPTGMLAGLKIYDSEPTGVDAASPGKSASQVGGDHDDHDDGEDGQGYGDDVDDDDNGLQGQMSRVPPALQAEVEHNNRHAVNSMFADDASPAVADDADSPAVGAASPLAGVTPIRRNSRASAMDNSRQSVVIDSPKRLPTPPAAETPARGTGATRLQQRESAPPVGSPARLQYALKLLHRASSEYRYVLPGS